MEKEKGLGIGNHSGLTLASQWVTLLTAFEGQAVFFDRSRGWAPSSWIPTPSKCRRVSNGIQAALLTAASEGTAARSYCHGG